jgi:hypothetical protein
MPLGTVKQICTPSSLVMSDSLVEQVAHIEDFATGKIDRQEFFRRNYFTDGLRRLVERGFERLAGKSDDGAFYLTQAMGGGKTHSLIAFGLLAADPSLRKKVLPCRGGHISYSESWPWSKAIRLLFCQRAALMRPQPW